SLTSYGNRPTPWTDPAAGCARFSKSPTSGPRSRGRKLAHGKRWAAFRRSCRSSARRCGRTTSAWRTTSRRWKGRSWPSALSLEKTQRSPAGGAAAATRPQGWWPIPKAAGTPGERTRLHPRQSLERALKDLPANWLPLGEHAGLMEVNGWRQERDELVQQ